MIRSGCRLLLLLFVMSAALVRAAPPTVQSPDQAQPLELPAAELQTTLVVLSQSFGVSIVARSELLQGLRHAPLSGRYTLPQALAELLQHSGLTFRRLADGYLLEPERRDATKNDEQLLVLGQQYQPGNPYDDGALAAALAYRLAEESSRPESLAILPSAALQFLPYENLAESLQYLPGVLLNRERGEGLSLSVRGLGPQYQRILFNRHVLAINENVRNSGQGGRQFRFDILAAEDPARVEINKFSSAPGAIGSEINIASMRPLELSEIPHYFRSEWEYQPRADKNYPALALRTGWRNKQQTLGVILGLQYRERFHYQDQYQTWNWDRNDNSWNNPGLDGRLSVPSNRFALTNEQEQRRRRNASLAAQWRPDEQQLWSLDYLISDLTFDFEEQRLLARLDAEDALFHQPDIQAATLLGAQADGIYLQSSLDTSRQRHHNQLWQGSYERHQGPWETELSVALSAASSTTDEPIRRTVINSRPTSLWFAAPADNRQLIFQPGLDVMQADNFVAIDELSRRDISARHEVQSWRLNSLYHFGDDVWRQWSSQLGLVQQQRYYRRQDVALDNPQPLIFSPLLALRRSSNRSFLPALDHAAVNHWLVPNNYLQQDYAQALSFTAPSAADRHNSHRSQEDVWQWYNRFAWQTGDAVSGTLELRYSRVELGVTGYRASQPLAQLHRYHYWLPAASLLWQPEHRWQTRLYLGRSLTLPNYQDLTPGLTLNSTDGVYLASGGNPALKPMLGEQLEFSLSFMPDSQQRWQYSVFAKRLHDYIVRDSRQQSINQQNYRVTLPQNSGRGDMLGHEISYDRAAADWGIQANASQVHSEIQYQQQRRALPQVSPLAASLVLYWQSTFFRSQGGINYRSDYLLEQGGDGVADVYVKAALDVQAQLSWNLGANSSLAVTVTNLLDREDIAYIRVAGEKIYRSLESSGPRFSLLFNKNF